MGSMYKSKKPLTVIAKKPPTRVQRIARDVALLKRNQKKSEFKWQDTPINLTRSGTGTMIQPIDNIGNGVGPNDYIGDEYTVKSLQVDIEAYTDLRGIADDAYLRISIVRYKSMNGNTPSYGPVGGSDCVYQADNVYSPRSMQNRNDFVIMKEWNITLDTANKELQRLTYYKKLNLVTVKDAPSGFTEQNGYFLIAYLHDVSGITASNLYIKGNCRIRFTDN